MVKVKIIKDVIDDEFVGGIYEAFRMEYTTGTEYIVNVAENNLKVYTADEVEVLSDTTAGVEEFTKDINMKDIMDGLGINVGDIVVVTNYHLTCNEKYELVDVANGYSSTIPNLILGMVSGKYGYKVFSAKCEVRGKGNAKVPVTHAG